MQKIIKKEKAITLITLVITIIILLILAGITISQLAGNGMFAKVKEAKEKYEVAKKAEENQLNEYVNEIDNSIVGSRNFKNLNYSFNEQELGTTWINGKKLYSITRFYDNNGNGYGKMTNKTEVEDTSTTLKIDQIIYEEHITSPQTQGYDFQKCGYVNQGNIEFGISNGKITLLITGTSTNWKIYATFVYTKMDS